MFQEFDAPMIVSSPTRERHPYLAYTLDYEDYFKALGLLARVHGEVPSKELSRGLADALIKVGEAGIQSYYRTPAKLLRINPFVRKSADLSIVGVLFSLRFVVKNSVKNMPIDQLRAWAHYLESLLVVHPTEPNKAYVVFVIPDELYKDIIGVLAQVRSGVKREIYAKEMIDTIIRLVDVGIKHFYRVPISLVKLNPLSYQTANILIAMVRSSIHFVVRRVLSDLSHSEMLKFTAYLESLILELDSKTYGRLCGLSEPIKL